MDVKVVVESELNPTEDEGKVVGAMANLTGSGSVRRVRQGRRVFLLQEGDQCLLIRFRSLLRSERILDAARKVILRGIEGKRIEFCVNKQVASAGHISFCQREGESPLGPISFHVVAEDPYSLIDWLATKTVDGVPVDELCRSESRRYVHSGRRSRT